MRGAIRPAGVPLALLVVVVALAAQAQHQVTSPGPGVPPLPTGDGTLSGRILHEDGRPLADVDVALYALAPDGRPGIGGTRTDEQGRYRFADVSSEPGVVYLLGVRYADVPFGQRAAFTPGQKELAVDLRVSDPVTDASALLVVGTVVQTEWIGSQLFVQVVSQVRNPDDRVIFVPETGREGARPVFQAALPPDAQDFMDGQSGMGGGLTRDGETLTFWGPIYPGDQELRYGFLLDAPDTGEGEAEIELALPFPAGAGAVSLLVPATDAAPRGDRVPEDFVAEQREGDALRRYELGGVAPGGNVALSFSLPESSADSDRLRIARADYWVDHDDTAMRITAEYELRVDSPTRLVARPGEALMRIDLPEDAEFLGLSGSARALGVVIDDAGGLEVRGPVPHGVSSLGFRYRVPVRGEAARLDLHFERPVELLNLLVADIGVAIETNRLHRRRPFKQGTRIYLHNEAFQLAAGETVEIVLRPIARPGLPPSVSVAGGLAAAALAALFLIGPLRRAGAGNELVETGETALSVERASLYDSIRDLEHDHETGKVETADFQRMRADLRAEAIDLLRQERMGEARPSSAPGSPLASQEAGGCPACREPVETDWRFCSHCGHDLRPQRGGAG